MKKTLLKASLIAMLGVVAFSNDFMNVNAMAGLALKGAEQEPNKEVEIKSLDEINKFIEGIINLWNSKDKENIAQMEFGNKILKDINDFKNCLMNDVTFQSLLRGVIIRGDWCKLEDKHQLLEMLKQCDVKVRGRVVPVWMDFLISEHKDSIEYAIVNEDFEKFISLSTNNELLEKKVVHLGNELSLLGFAALVGNLQVFNHLLINGFKIDESVVNAALQGGNIEIFEIIKQKGFSFEKGLVNSMNPEMVKWIYDEYNPIVDGRVLGSLICRGGYSAALALLEKIIDKNKTVPWKELFDGFVFCNVADFYAKILMEEFKRHKDYNEYKNGSFGRFCVYFGFLDELKHQIEECKVDLKTLEKTQTRGGAFVIPIKVRNSLHVASEYGHLDIVKYLIEDRKVDPNIKDKYGMNPLHVASQNGHLDIVKYLVEECKADPNIKDNKGETPLHFALEKGHLGIVKYLVEECKVDPNITDKYGMNLLHLGSKYGHLAIVKYLIEECKFDPNITDDNDKAPLYFATRNGHLAIVKYLVEECKVNPNIKGEWVRAPLYIASEGGYLDIVKYLIEECKVDPNIKDMYGETPLDIARRCCKPDLVKYLEMLPTDGE